MANVNELQLKLASLKGKRDSLLEVEKEKKKNITLLTEKLETITTTQVHAQNVAKNLQDKIKFHIKDMVQNCLDIVFPEMYEFNFEFIIKAGKTEANIFLTQDGEEIKPEDSTGGGVVDVISLGMRIVALTLSTNDKVLILDEPFKFISKKLKPLAGQILKEISKELEVQFLIVTHDEEIINVSDRIFHIEKGKDGVSRSEMIIPSNADAQPFPAIVSN